MTGLGDEHHEEKISVTASKGQITGRHLWKASVFLPKYHGGEKGSHGWWAAVSEMASLACVAYFVVLSFTSSLALS